MKKYVVFLLTLFFLFNLSIFAFAAPEWVPLIKGVTSKVPEMKLIQTKSPDVKILEVTIPGFYRETKKAGDNNALFVTTPISSRYMEKGLPELPTMKNFIMLKDGETLDTKVIYEDWTEFKLKEPIAPSKGHLTRNINPDDVKYEYSDFYNSKDTFPGLDKKVVVGEKFTLRDFSGVEITVNPFQYDNDKKVLKVAKKVRVELKFNSTYRSVTKKVVPYEFLEIYKDVFMNFVPGEVIERIELGKVLVITADQFEKAVIPLVDWKKKQGFEVKLAKMSEIGTTADQVYAYIKNEFDKNGITYIILVGDTEFVPTLLGVKERAASDPCYTKLVGNDHVPDAMISRISAKTIDDVKNQVTKIIHYEQFPDVAENARWYKKATGIASAEGKPTDYERAEWLRESLMKYTYETVDQIYDPRASKAKLIEAINEGRSLINYIGHGSKTSWVTTGFSNYDIAALKNGRMLPVIWSVACVNGQFNGGSDCFCEAWMKAGSADNPQGAIAIFGASTNAEWVPPCDMQYEINKVQLVGEKQSSVGALALTGILKAMQIWGTAPNSSGVMLFEQYNLFGDCSMVVRTDIPKSITFDVKRNNNQLVVNVNANNKPVKYARVALTFEDGKTLALVTNENGNCEFNLNTLYDEQVEKRSNNCLITITGLNLVPIVDKAISF